MLLPTQPQSWGGLAIGPPIGVLTTSSTPVGNGADVTDDPLWAVTLPAGALSGNGMSVRLRLQFGFAANGHQKTVRITIGATGIVLFASGGYQGGGWSDVVVMRTTAGHQIAFAAQFATGTAIPQISSTACTTDDTLPIAIVVSGQSDTAAANDIVLVNGLLELNPAQAIAP